MRITWEGVTRAFAGSQQRKRSSRRNFLSDSHDDGCVSSVYSQLFVHLVWATWDRRPAFDDRKMRRLCGRFASLCAEDTCVLLASGGVSDHVHLLVSLHQDLAVSTLVQHLKVSTSQFVRHTLSVPEFAWQQGYGAFSLRETECDVVRRYICNQARHHAEGTTLPDWERCSCDPAKARVTPSHVMRINGTRRRGSRVALHRRAHA